VEAKTHTLGVREEDMALHPCKSIVSSIGVALIIGCTVIAVSLAQASETGSPSNARPEMMLQIGHSGEVRSVAFSPDGYYTGSTHAERYIGWRVGDKVVPGETYRQGLPQA
jgi:hypothetical protein